MTKEGHSKEFVIMIENIANAVEILQKRNACYFYSSPYWTERVDRAIDTLLRHPHSTRKPYHLIKNALSDARKVMHRRSQICPIAEVRNTEEGTQLQQSVENLADSSANSVEFILGIIDWLNNAPLNSNYRTILSLLMQGYEAEDIAIHLDLTVKEARVRISQARRRAKALWKEDTNV